MGVKLTKEIKKSFDSGFFHSFYAYVPTLYVIRYRGNLFLDGPKILVFNSENKAKSYLRKWVENVFHHGEYWQSCKNNIKKNTGYEVDFSATIKILPSYGLTSRFQLPENKKMFKDFAEELIKEEIVVIEKLTTWVYKPKEFI